MVNLVIFASGSGSNANKVCSFFENSNQVKVNALFCNNPKAGVIAKMEKYGVPVIVFSREQFNNSEKFLELISPYQPDLIALLGFLWKIPAYLVQTYPHKIINLHPALLPKYGGKGMYGHFVHEAVKAAGESETGITIHWVNEHYDEGEIIAQYKCTIEPTDTADSIAEKIHVLEQQYVPQTLNTLVIDLSLNVKEV